MRPIPAWEAVGNPSRLGTSVLMQTHYAVLCGPSRNSIGGKRLYFATIKTGSTVTAAEQANPPGQAGSDITSRNPSTAPSASRIYLGDGLAGPANQPLTLDARRSALRLFSKALYLVGEPPLKGCGLFETTTLLHFAPHSMRRGRERNWRSHHR
jgi:hypothetical protein